MTRADLAPGAQAVQAAHAALEFSVTHPVMTAQWSAGEGSLLLLAAAGELELLWLMADAEREAIPFTLFREPDLGGEVTALALLGAARICSKYPLAMKGIQHV